MIDSVFTLNEGTGGSYQAYVGMAKGFKNLSIGFNTGYYFGTRDVSSKKTFIPDSVDVSYFPSNYETKISFGGIFLNLGAQYAAQLNKKTILHLGVYGSTRQSFKADKDSIAETFNYDANGGVLLVDSVATYKSHGKVQTPATIGVGFIVDRLDKWQFGVDFNTTLWDQYSMFNEKEQLRNS